MAEPFQYRGVNHLALVCRDMARTVDFYTNVLGMQLVKTIDLPAGSGQHFFFDCGNGDSLAFFWFPDAPEPAPGVSAPAVRPDQGEFLSAIGSMNHIAFDVPAERFDEYRDKLKAKGVKVTMAINHSDSLDGGHKADYDPATDDGDVFVRSIYFTDPNGTRLEFACWTKTFGPDDVKHEAATATGMPVTA